MVAATILFPQALSTTTATTTATNHNNQGLLLSGKGDQLLEIVLRNAPANQWTQWLRLPLMGAAVGGDVVCVKELLAAGADGSAGQRGPDGSTLVREISRHLLSLMARFVFENVVC